MDDEHSPVTPPPASDARRRGRDRAARICGVVCLGCMLLLGAAAIVLLGTDVMGCWGSAYLFLACAVVLGVPAVVLLIVAVCLKPAELLWLGLAALLIYGAAELAFALLPPVLCSGSG